MSLILLCTNYIPSGTTPPPNGTSPPPNTTATPQPPFSDCLHCLNGGTYVRGYCQCLAGYSGVYCEMAIYSPPGTYVWEGYRFTCTGDVVNSAAMHLHTLPRPFFFCMYIFSFTHLLYSFSSLPSLSCLTLSPLSPPSTLTPHSPPSLHPPSCTHLPDRLGLSLWRMLQWHL